jgi:pSer/pThr/pTyr-binding forkhead associated (FHA) protein
MIALGGTAGLRYLGLEPTGAMHLVANPGRSDEQRIAFCRVLEIDRDDAGREAMPGLLLVQDPLASRHQCVLTRSPNGRCYVRDVSLDGTRLSGRRLVPNVETEIRPGEILTVGSHHFILDAAPERGESSAPR